MTAMDGDGIDEELTRAVSVAMLAAARAGEQFARMNQAAAQGRQARTAGQTEQAQRELDAHSEAARAYFEVTARPEYTSAATADQLREVARQAQAWRERLPEAQRAQEAAAAELTTRKGNPGDLERASVLAGEADAADRRDESPEVIEQPSNTIGEPDPMAGDDTRTQRAAQVGEEAAITAKTAQARPAQEAPAGARSDFGRPRRRRPALARTRQAGIDR